MKKEYAVKVTRVQETYVTVYCEQRLVEKTALEAALKVPHEKWEDKDYKAKPVSVLEPLD